jgi:biopolymer transport protein ExbB
VLELVQSGGWLMVPILLCSVAAVAIIIERLWYLRKKRIAPPQLVAQVQQALARKELTADQIAAVGKTSPLGRILAVGLLNMERDREVMKDAIEEVGRHIVHELGRYLNTLGTIAAITPLLGLLGTVIGMIQVFAAITSFGVGDPTVLAGGISQALITTAAGLSIGIPALMFHRYFRGRVNELTVEMEQQALHLVEFIHGERELDKPARGKAESPARGKPERKAV